MMSGSAVYFQPFRPLISWFLFLSSVVSNLSAAHLHLFGVRRQTPPVLDIRFIIAICRLNTILTIKIR